MYNDYTVLDTHSHLRASLPSAMFFKQLLSSNTALPSPIAPGKTPPPGPFGEGMRDGDFLSAAERHAAYLDARSIDVQILGPHPVDYNGFISPHLFKAWTSYVNDMIFKVCQARPDRWVGACQLPQDAHAHDISHALPELERCVHDYGFAATYVSPDVTGRRDSPGLDDPYWYPLYDLCEQLDLPIIVHGTTGQDPRFRNVPHNYQLAFLSEQYFALQFLRHADVFVKFPRLRVMICHCGGALDRFVKDSPAVTPHPERDLTNNLFFDSCAYDVDFLAAAIHQRTVSQTCFGVEAPGSGGAIRKETGRPGDDLVPIITSHPKLAFLSEQDKIDILHNNPARFCPGLADPVATNGRAKFSAYAPQETLEVAGLKPPT